ncbi:MAG TPA: hypothetical protein V6D19_02155 [Stenomitos sp.]
MTIQRFRRKRLAPLPLMLIFSKLNTRTSTALFGSSFAAVGLITHEYQFVLGSTPVIIAAIRWNETKRLLNLFGRIPAASQTLILGTITLLGVCHFFVMPAEAVFLDKACGLLSSVFSSAGASVDPVKITINVIRAMFIIYIAIALIQVFNNLSRDEDWQTAVRAPILAILVIVIVDVISSLVTTGGSTC